MQERVKLLQEVHALQKIPSVIALRRLIVTPKWNTLVSPAYVSLPQYVSSIPFSLLSNWNLPFLFAVEHCLLIYLLYSYARRVHCLCGIVWFHVSETCSVHVSNFLSHHSKIPPVLISCRTPYKQKRMQHFFQ